MLQNINIDWEKLNELTNTLGIKREDLKTIIADRDSSNSQAFLTAGPKLYTSSYYGTISIKDF
ncbi:MAG: hypothetical protein JSU91_04915 [Thermoplasmatales archaeon]|nr:MAG: hypothetical protein JSU91_04915 [Thermoplasmatales archaeon]